MDSARGGGVGVAGGRAPRRWIDVNTAESSPSEGRSEGPPAPPGAMGHHPGHRGAGGRRLADLPVHRRGGTRHPQALRRRTGDAPGGGEDSPHPRRPWRGHRSPRGHARRHRSLLFRAPDLRTACSRSSRPCRAWRRSYRLPSPRSATPCWMCSRGRTTSSRPTSRSPSLRSSARCAPGSPMRATARVTRRWACCARWTCPRA